LNVKGINLTIENDPSIIGGFNVKTPIAEVDCSVQNQINNLKKAI
jgi:F0F1-type ATP synthase delta subunit